MSEVVLTLLLVAALFAFAAVMDWAIKMDRKVAQRARDIRNGKT